ncbi:tetratricopeptide repeat protein [Allorhodopirellula heiligendammensis]|uniref:Tetratricopeptide repeat protein n=1 Tax=Allorhodopirellula heiligendammensis TaxID=2714739 RepID=A0A5C6BYT4_9BACT|nr:tetratricopeptide repeat protein [Allorhodopirellula heiligendammensis]TWU16054.1 Tetratricopeptide repeat protein [Allorhodopirellula heiligendammensis]
MIQYLNPLQWMKWWGQFLFEWCVSIPWRQVSAGLPAMFLVGVLAVLGYLAYSDGGSWRRNLVKQQQQEAFQKEDFATAALLSHRQINAGNDTSDNLYRLAIAQYQLDKKDEAIAVMRQLVARRRDDQAALWLAKELYSGKSWADLSVPERTDFGSLLTLLSSERPDDMVVKLAYMDYLTASGRYAEAIPLLQRLATIRPMYGWQAAILARQIGDTDLATRLASTTLETMQKLHSEEPANPALAIAVVRNQIFLNRHAEAVQVLADSIARMKTAEEQQALRQAMGDTIAAWVSEIKSQPNTTAAERLRVLKLLQVALQYAPNNPQVLTLVADQVLATLNSSDADVVEVRNALVQGTSPGIAHFIRGTTAMMNDDVESAQRHLKLAAEHLPNSSAILNNLAVALAQQGEEHLEEALKLSSQAIKSVDQPSPYFYETRGQILFKMKRYLDAIPDLERALAVDALAANAHLALAECYENLGEPDLAADHQSAADRLKAATPQTPEESKPAPALAPESDPEQAEAPEDQQTATPQEASETSP